MAKQPETLPRTSGELAPIVAIGGLLTVKQLAEWYRPILAKDKTSGLPCNKRFLAPPQRGLGRLDEMREEASERLYKLYDRLDQRKMFIVGHSLGGLMASVAALETPEIIAGVVSLGGVHEGYNKETPATLALRYSLGNPAEAKHLWHESDFMMEHKEKMASSWSADIPFHVIATPLDYLVVPPQGFGVSLAHGEPDKKIVVLPVPGAETITRRGFGLGEDVGMLRSWYPTEHVNLPRNPDIAAYIDTSRHELAGLGSSVLTATRQDAGLSLAA